MASNPSSAAPPTYSPAQAMPEVPQVPEIQAVLFDYGLVLTGPAHPPAWEHMKSLLNADEAAFHAAYWRQRQDYDAGTLTAEAYWRNIASEFQQPSNGIAATLIAGLIEADTELWTQPNQPMIRWAAALQARGVLTGILSNLGDAMEEGVRARCPWLEAFDHLTFSHRVRTTKPDSAIYRHAAAGLSTPPGHILFVDDRADNIAGARAAGMQAIRYLDHESFVREVQAAGFASLLGEEPDASARTA